MNAHDGANTQLIPIRTNNDNPAVLGRDLHAFLEVATAYKDWFPRMVGYGFEEEKDFSSFLSESTGGRPRTDHIITLDMAKEISMIQRTDKGKQARQYFIECERRAKEAPQMSGEELMARALLQADSTIKELRARATNAEAVLESAAPALEYHEKFVAEDADVTKIDDFARVYGTTGPKVRQLLKEKDIAFRSGIGSRWSQSKRRMVEEFEWRARAGRPSYQWFELRPQHNAPRLHNGQVRQTLYVKTFHMIDLAKKLGLEPVTPLSQSES